MMIIIDTADGETVTVVLVSQQGKILAQRLLPARYRQAEELLPAVNAVIQAARSSMGAVKGIAVVAGPGPFTAVRVGVAVANTIAWQLKLPIVKVNKNKFSSIEELIATSRRLLSRSRQPTIIEPTYGQPPSITKRRPRN